MALAVIIPTFQERDAIADCIARVQSVSTSWKIVVADGGSTDGTCEIAREHGADEVINAPRGRGQQMSIAAKHFQHHDLMFLHADCLLPFGCKEIVEQILQNKNYSGGCFQVNLIPTSNAGPIVKLFLQTANWRARRTAFPYGDQAVFCRRDIYEQCGGMPIQPLMEDLEFAGRLNAITPIKTLDETLEVSGRRFCHRPWKTSICWHSFPWLYRLGVSAERLARWYGIESR